jgi:hypothetical protein
LAKILKFFDADADPDPRSGNIFDPGSGIRDGIIRIRDPGSATLNIIEKSINVNAKPVFFLTAFD